jgi:hypothetical protein
VFRSSLVDRIADEDRAADRALGADELDDAAIAGRTSSSWNGQVIGWSWVMERGDRNDLAGRSASLTR